MSTRYTWIMKATGGKGFGRRTFLKLTGVVPVLGSSSMTGAFLAEDFPVRTVEKDNFRFDPKTGFVRWTDKKTAEPYSLLIDGLVERPVRLSYKDLRTLPYTSQISDLHCVEGWSVPDIRWGGFRFREVLEKVRPKPNADYIVFHALGETESKPQGQAHYIESFPLSELLGPKKKCLLVLDMNKSPLPHDHGAPLRLVAPYSLGYKSIKFVARIEFASKPRPGWWTLANPIYPIEAPVPAGRLKK